MGTQSQAVEFRPRRIRVVAAVAAVAILVLFTVLSFGLKGATGSGPGQFRAGDQLAMIGLGLAGALGALVFARPRVRADAAGVRVRNVVGGYDLPWAVVRAVRFDRNCAWAQLELQDDDTVPVHALQAVDKLYAVEGVRALRALHAAANGPVDS
ncbi:MAG TPA: PH domain-containing protein [Actinoplanes sp.]|nr:PH domain-containing protein [Actinoplanes sp.]